MQAISAHRMPHAAPPHSHVGRSAGVWPVAGACGRPWPLAPRDRTPRGAPASAMADGDRSRSLPVASAWHAAALARWPLGRCLAVTIQAATIVGRTYSGCNRTGHACIARNYAGHNYTGHNYTHMHAHAHKCAHAHAHARGV